MAHNFLKTDYETLTGRCFCNPPYSEPRPWCDRLASYLRPWCALLKLDPTTQWWSALVAAGPHWAPFRKRLRFDLHRAEQ